MTALGQTRWALLLSMAQAEVESLRQGLPEPLKDEAARLPVTFERKPDREMLASGVQEDTLGIFVGLPLPESESGAMDLPPQVILFLESLWDFAGEETLAYREEVRRTYLHELGHYLGLDEDDLFERDLD